MLALFLATAGCFSSRSTSGKSGTSIPAIAELAGVKIGLSVPSATSDFDRQEAVDAPTARLPKEKFAWMGGVQLGMSRSAVEQFLKSKSLAATATNQDLVLQAPGHNAITDHPGAYETWGVILTFETNVLIKLNIYANERTTR